MTDEEISNLRQSAREGWRYADELEQERKRLTGEAAVMRSLLRECDAVLSIVEPDISWVKLAEGMGVEAASADNCETLVKLLRHAVARPGPFLIEARIGR